MLKLKLDKLLVLQKLSMNTLDAPNGYSLLVVGVPQSGGLSGGTLQIVSTYPASPEARPPSFLGKPAVRPRSMAGGAPTPCGRH